MKNQLALDLLNSRPRRTPPLFSVLNVSLLLPALLLLAALPAARAVTQSWQGLGADGNWDTAGNFSPGGGVISSDALVFDGNNYLTTNFNNIGYGSVDSFTFNVGAGAFTLNGNALRINTSAGITNLSSNLQTISLASLGVSPSQTWDAGTAGLHITSPILFELFGGSVALTVTGSGNTLIEGDMTEGFSIISGAGSLIKTGAGTLTLTGNNSYTAGTMVTGGTLAVLSNTGLGSGTVTVDNSSGSGATLRIAASVGNAITLDQGALLENSGTITRSGANQTGVRSAVSGTSAVVRNLSGAKIESIDSHGVLLQKGGTVQNTGGVITGGGNGVYIVNAPGAVTNESGGNITGSTHGVHLGIGGTLINTSSTIRGLGIDGVVGGSAVGSTTSVQNLAGGYISGLRYGVYLPTSGTLVNSAGSVIVGSGTAVVGVSAAVSVTNSGSIIGSVELGNHANATTLNVGSLISGNLNMGSSSAALLTLAGTGTQVYSTAVTGSTSFSGSLMKQDAGTWTLDRNLLGVASTQINNGTLRVTGRLGGEATVASGATLAGSGTISGAVTVQNGGILSPGNSPGTLNVGALTLNAAAVSEFELGTTSDLVVVDNDFTLDGILNLSDSGGFANTSYTLFTYGGALTNNYFEVSAVPTGWNRANFVIDLSSSGTVRLLVDNTVTIQNWTGTNTSPNGTISGGSGTWNNVLTNWTNTNGSLNTQWQGVVGVFGGTAGTVNVADVVAFQQVQFVTDGYVLNGSGTLAVTGSSSEVWTGSGVGAEIATTISGTGALVKSGGGTLRLSGSNTYEGGTHLNNGLLRIGSDDALGTGTLTISGGNLANGGADEFTFVDNNIVANADFSILVEGSLGLLEMEGNVSLGTGTRTITFAGDGLACFGGVISGEGLTLVSSGSLAEVEFCGADSNTFTGPLTLQTGVQLLLGKDPGALAVAGDVVIDAGAALGLAGEDQIATTSNVTVNGDFDLFLAEDVEINGLLGSGNVIGGIFGSILAVNSGTFNGTLSDGGDPLALVKQGAGVLELASASTYTGGTTITAGTLETHNSAALGSGPVLLSGGSLAPVGQLDIASLDWTGGTIASTLGTTTSFVNIAGNLTLTSPGEFVFTGDGGFAPNTAYAVLGAASLAGFDTADFTGNTLFGLAPIFTIVGDTLYVSFQGASTGPLLQNSGPVYTPTDADFRVNGAVKTGGPADNNTVNSLTFNPGSSLRVFNNLTVTSGKFDVPTGSASLNGGNVITPGDLNKNGQGSLITNTNFLVGGAANINAGALIVNGRLTANAGVTVFQNALLGGSGLINGDLFNNGIVAPGNSPGTLTVNGNFTQSASGTLQIEVASRSVFDILAVTGRANLAGTLQILNYGGNTLKYGQQIPFLQAGSISGEFDQILMPDPSKNRGRFLVDGGTGILLVAPTSYTLVAKTGNQRNVARALDSFITARGDDRETVSIALDLQSEEQYPAAFEQISPAFYESLADITIEQINGQNQNLAQRAGGLRLGARGFQSIGIESPLVHDKDGKSVMDAKDGKDILTPAPDNKWGLWVQGNGLFARVTNASQVPNYNFESGGFLAGADYRWSENFVTGLYGGYQGTYAKYNDGGRTTINSVQFGGYASYDNGGFYVDAIVGGGYSAYAVRRPIKFSTIDRTARSRPDGGQFTTYLDMGYDWKLGNFTLGPIASGQYTYAGIAPFTETGADSLDLSVAQQNANSLRTSLGGRIAYTWKVTDAFTLIPEGRMFWQHEFLENPRNIGASLDGGNGDSFGYTTSTPDRDAVFAGMGLIGQFGPSWNAYFYYNADFGRQDFISHAISTGLNFKF